MSRTDEWVSLHNKVLRGDCRSRDEIAARLIARATPIVRSRRLGSDADIVGQAVLDAVMDYLQRPLRFDPKRASLLTWVAFAALRNVDDAVRREWARKAAEASAVREYTRASSGASPPERNLAAVIRVCLRSNKERAFFAQWLESGSPMELAEVLGLAVSNQATVNKAVRLFKERLRLRLKRAVLKQKRSATGAGAGRRWGA